MVRKIKHRGSKLPAQDRLKMFNGVYWLLADELGLVPHGSEYETAAVRGTVVDRVPSARREGCRIYFENVEVERVSEKAIGIGAGGMVFWWIPRSQLTSPKDSKLYKQVLVTEIEVREWYANQFDESAGGKLKVEQRPTPSWKPRRGRGRRRGHKR
jgi:hypothetical protein